MPIESRRRANERRVCRLGVLGFNKSDDIDSMVAELGPDSPIEEALEIHAPAQGDRGSDTLQVEPERGRPGQFRAPRIGAPTSTMFGRFCQSASQSIGYAM